MGNSLCRDASTCPSEEVVVQRDNPLHLKVIAPRHILAPLPELRDLAPGLDLRELNTERPLFEDPDFPAGDASIGGLLGDKANPNVAQYLEDMMKMVVPGWVRPRQMMGKEAGKYKLFAAEGEPCLFQRVSPRDIEQGYLGDCWMVSAMATLAEYPDRVRSLFRQHSLTEDGRYDVRLYDPKSEEWKAVTIDDRLPYWQRPGKHGNLCFAKPTKENEFWPCLLEKAVAKFVQSYHRLDGGFESVAMEMFTGKPALCMRLNPHDGAHSPYYMTCGWLPWSAAHATVYQRIQSFDAGWFYYTWDASRLVGGQRSFGDEELWQQLKDWNQEGYDLACSSRGDYKGILGGHAYTLLRLLDVPLNPKKEASTETSVLKLLHVRNPHRTNEWFGRFHDDDWETWNAYPEALKLTGHTVGIKDNGVFWMEWAEFKNGFQDVGVCFDKQNPGARYTDDSVAALREHHQVSWGIVGHQKWEGF
ncbi:unnamed protein product [Effrenium voratum]|uniref:Calpain catalytic domain-containing protein n=1 Tax=Effrenium voratum TaxID=2562239 RepID=A0AA36IKG6_9DINO|nr:unnamed protein product [Effrenium voratum]CAJ1458699.1 unnamed protein product [Effrenium voratum]